jgi:hypothetical protein
MNRTKLLATVIVVLLFAIPARAQELDARTPLSLDLNLDSRATFETLAEAAGLNIVFVRNYTPKAAQPFRIENKTPVEALDQLAKQTATFWSPWDKRTILVAEDNEQNRRDYDRQFVQVLPVANRSAQDVANDLRARGLRLVVPVGNAIMVRDLPAQIRVAAQAANPLAVVPTLDLNGVFVAETIMSWRTPETRRAELKIKTTNPVSLNISQDVQAIYENLANIAGLNILFGRTLPRTNARFVVRNVGLFDALDLLALTTNTFWQPLNDNTILVLEDSQQNRRDFDLQTAETIYLPAEISTNRLNEIMNSLRIGLSLRGIYQSESAKALVIRATPARITLVESLIADISGSPIRKKVATDIRTSFSETEAFFHTAASDRDQLQIKARGPIVFNSTAITLREAFEKLAGAAGLQVLFGRNFPTRRVDFNIRNVDAIEALDFLALQSGAFWQPLDARTILVLDDNQQNKRDFDAHQVKTIYLPREISVNGMNEIMNILRTALTLRGVYQAETPRAILIHDIPQRVALAETIVEHLNTLPTPPKSVQIPARNYAETGIYGIANAVRPELSLSGSAPVSINLTQDTRATFEVLADMAGIKVNFSPDFVSRGAQLFRLEGVDVLDALDYFSLITANAWKVVDRQTIMVFPDTQQNRTNLEPQNVKTFFLAYRPSQNTVTGIVNALRTAMALRNVQSGEGAITIQETPQRMIIVERVVESLDRPALAPANPETVSLRVVLSSYQGNVETRTQSHALNVEVGADRETLKSGSTVPISIPGGSTVQQQVGVQIDSVVGSAGQGRYRVALTITVRDVLDENPPRPIPQRVPSVPIFRNFIFAGTLVLEDGGTAQISGIDPANNQTFRADVTLSLKK